MVEERDGSFKEYFDFYTSELLNIENFLFHHFDLEKTDETEENKFYKMGKGNIRVNYKKRKEPFTESIDNLFAENYSEDWNVFLLRGKIEDNKRVLEEDTGENSKVVKFNKEMHDLYENLMVCFAEHKEYLSPLWRILEEFEGEEVGYIKLYRNNKVESEKLSEFYNLGVALNQDGMVYFRNSKTSSIEFAGNALNFLADTLDFNSQNKF